MSLTWKKITLHNFLSHRHEEIEIPETGLVLLWGPSGAGKTTIPEAVAFALYGPRVTRGNMEELRHEDYPDEDFYVEVTFRVLDEDLTVYRGIRGSKTVVWLSEPDGTKIEGAEPVAQRVGEITGTLDGPTFFSTFFAAQGQMDTLVKRASGERRKFIQRMMGVSVLDKVTKDIREQNTRTSQRLQILDEQMPVETEDDLTATRDDAAQTVTDAQAAAQAAEAELQACELQRDALTGRHQAARQQATALQSAQQRASALSERIPALEGSAARAAEQVTEASAAAQRAAAKAGLRERAEQLRKTVTDLSSAEGALQSLERLRSDTAAATATADAAQEALSGIVEVSGDAAAQVTQLSTRRDQLLSEHSAAKKNLDDAEQTLARLHHDGKCFVCLREMDEGDESAHNALGEKIAACQAEVNRIVAEGRDVADKLAKANAEAAAAAQSAERNRQLTETARAKAAEKDRLATQLAAAEQQSAGADAAALAAARKELEDSAADLHALAADEALASRLTALQEQASDIEAQLSQARGELEDVQRQIALSDFDEDALTALETELTACHDRHAALRGQVGEARGQIAAASAQRDAAQAALDRLNKISAERAQAATEAQGIAQLAELMVSFKTDVVGRIRPTLEINASKHLSDLTDGRMSALLIDDQYDLEVVHDGDARQVKMLSGGEQARTAFALRLALSQMLAQQADTPLGFMVFDEIFGSQDPEHRKAILEVLRYLRGTCPQVFLISHEESLRDSDLIDVVIDVPDSASENRVQVTTR